MINKVIDIFGEYDRSNDLICEKIKSELDGIRGAVEEDLSQKLSCDIRMDNFKGQTKNMPIVPFVSFFIKETGWTNTKGFYLVFLFDKGFDYVYLSLVYGTEYMNKTEIDSLSESFRSMLDFPTPKIDLRSDSLRPKKYESSTLKCYKYSIQKFAAEFNFEDFKKLFNIYSGISKNSIFIDILNMNEVFTSEIKKRSISNGSNKNSKAKKGITYEDIQRANEKYKEIGNAGEDYVLTFENDKLRQQGINKKAKLIARRNENAGYDILSYKKIEGKLTRKFIEVKTSITTRQDFYISKSEMEFMEANKENYYIYLVRGFNMLSNEGVVEVLPYKSIKSYNLIPTKYYAKK